MNREEIFHEALDLPESERALYLERACAGDAEARAEVESLLAAHAQGRAFFERGSGLPPFAGGMPAPDAAAGTEIGAYRLTRRIGVGGMGAVYEAERTDGAFRRRVAVKLLRPELWTPATIESFRRERQVLADLRHPNIAALLDGGSTAEGAPYLVMEFVDGEPIDRYCDERRLDVEARLRLFLHVCAAVRYAHANLVVHRDLKPSNILISRDGEVKLLDFGIAKVLAAEDEELARRTLTQDRALTPLYASPEQLRAERVTTASDVYSLGVLLYELLCGRSPYRARAGGLTALEHEVLEEMPERPSKAVAESAATPEVAAARSTTSERLLRRLGGDLDTIVLRALAKEPERRYAGADALAADLERHLAGEAVEARGDTTFYRLSRFARRHRSLVGSIAAVIVVLVAALAVALSASYRADEARRDAERHAYANALAAAEFSILAGQIGDARARLEEAPEHLRGWEWKHLVARLDRSARTWTAHRGGIPHMELSEDGSRMLTASLDSTVALWAMPAGVERARWGPFDAEVEWCAAALRAEVYAAGLADGTILLLSHDPGDSVVVLGRGELWSSVAVSPDGRWLAGGYLNGTLRIWDTATRAEVTSWRDTSGLAVPAFSPSGDYLLTGDGAGSVTVRRTGTWRIERKIAAHSRRIYCIAFHPDGSRFVTGSLEPVARVWDPATGEAIASFREHRATVGGLTFLPGSNSVVSAAADGRVMIWNAASGALEAELRGHTADVGSVAAAPNGTIYTGDWSGVVRAYARHTDDVRTLRVTTGAHLQIPSAIEARFDPTGRRLAHSSIMPELHLWNLSRNEPAARFPLVAQRAAWCESGRRLLVGERDGDLLRCDPLNGNVEKTVRAHGGPVRFLVAAPGGDRCATAADSVVRIWSSPGLDSIATIRPTGGRVRALAIDSDGTTLAVATSDSTVRLYRARDGSLLREEEVSEGVQALAFDRRGSRLAWGGSAGAIEWFELAGRGSKALPLPSARNVRALAFSPDGSRIAAGGSDQLVRVFDTASGIELLQLHGHVAAISSLEFSPDGARLASASADGTVRIWDSGP